MILETVRVVNPNSDNGMIINATDFDPKIHTMFEKPIAQAKIDVIPDESLPVEPDTVAPEKEVVLETKKGRPFSKNLKK